MEETVLLVNMTMLLLIGGVCSIIFKKLRMPAAIGYIVCGIILSNYWGGESTDTEEIVELLADMGLVLMMFCIGMELNLKKLRKMGSFSIMVVMIQVPIMLMGGFVGGSLLGLDALQSIVFGAIISGSSTAVITIVLAEQDRISRADVETIVLITVIEDVAQVLIMSAVSPLMGGKEMELAGIVWMLMIVIAFMAIAVVVGLMFIPKFLDYVGEKYSDEILLVTSLGMCFALSYISVTIGMSMAIGAFLMGVITSQAKQQKRIEHQVMPMRNVFMMMFFVSIGLLIKPEDILNNITTIIVIYLIYFVLKAGSVIVAYFVGNKPLRLSFFCSISLVAMGEFAFIISKEAFNNGIISNDLYASIIGAALVSMIALPLINRKAEKLADFIQNKTPQPVVEGFLRMEATRSNYYTKMSQATKETMTNFRNRLAFVYVNLILIALIQIIFFLITPVVADFFNSQTPDTFDLHLITIMILVLNFVILVPLILKMINNSKYLFRVFLDSERKAASNGTATAAHGTVSKLIKLLLRVNNWVLMVMINFVVLTLTPSSIDFYGHLIVTLAGILVVSVLQIISYLRRS